MSQHDNAALALAVLSAVLASGAFFLSLRTKRSLKTIPPVPPPVVESPAAPKKEDSSEDDDSSDKEKEIKYEIIDDAYKRIHQRYNRLAYKWDDFDPLND